MEVALGDRHYDITTRALVMGILNRTPDSFFDQGSYFEFDAFLRQAEGLVEDGADLLDVGGVKAGPGPEVSEAEELERVVPAIEALHARFDVPLSVDTSSPGPAFTPPMSTMCAPSATSSSARSTAWARSKVRPRS